MAQLEEALQAYRDAQAQLSEVQAAAAEMVRAHRELIEHRRLELAAAMVASAVAGTRQVEIIRRTGYSREQVRTILRAGGVEPE
jgi:acyl-CoA reductase-like NAD-dependent aldehyde dehydrogenase